MRTLIPLLAAILIAAPAWAQSAASEAALEESGEAFAAGGEASVKTASAVAAVPASGLGLASTAAGEVAEGAGRLAADVGEESLEAGVALSKFAAEPLSVDDEIIVAPMPEPQVPYEAQR
jgi:hypothetical protein